MAHARVNEQGIKERQRKIAAWEQQISVWRATGDDKSAGMKILRESVEKAKSVEEKEILSRVKTLQFVSEADKADLAKLAGRLEAFDSIYYDIADAAKKIENAEAFIAKLVDEIKRAKKGELVDTGA